jgi:hypothetical protein
MGFTNKSPWTKELCIILITPPPVAMELCILAVTRRLTITILYIKKTLFPESASEVNLWILVITRCATTTELFILVTWSWSWSRITADSQSVSQSVSVSVSSPLWDMRSDTNFAWNLLSCLCGAPSVTRGRVCLLPVTVSSNCSLSSFPSPPFSHAPSFVAYTTTAV